MPIAFNSYAFFKTDNPNRSTANYDNLAKAAEEAELSESELAYQSKLEEVLVLLQCHFCFLSASKMLQ